MKTHLEKTCIFYEFWHHFGRLLAPFWEPKCNQKSSEILEAILEVKKGDRLIFWERPGGMRGGPGEDNGGVRERTPAENSGREPRRRQGTLEGGLARRPRWGGGTLRAFRWAGLLWAALRILWGSQGAGVSLGASGTISNIFHEMLGGI